MISKQIGKLEISFEDHIRYEQYSCQWYDVLTIFIENSQYDIINNHVMGYRLNITNRDGSWKDIPFKETSFEMIPQVKVKINE